VVETAKRQNPAPLAEALSQPPGKAKIVEALKTLLREKEFDAITWREIAQTAGVTEGLIYKYFGDRRNLLFQVLKEYLELYLLRTQRDVKGIEGSINKLRKLTWSSIDFYTSDVVFAKILLLEVRNLPSYFESDTYLLVKNYSGWILGIIKDGVEEGEIRDDIPPEHVRDSLLGAIEPLCLPAVIFRRKMDPDKLAGSLCTILFESIRKRPGKINPGAK
jgi:TetR/AcrR family transcriptional regulator, fatty acid metabolism regulator protein